MFEKIFIQAYLILLCFFSLYFADIMFFINWRFVAMLHRTSLLVPFFQQHLLMCVSVSHFGNSGDILRFFIIIILLFVIVICGQ